jgi:flagellar assembly protein FliH
VGAVLKNVVVESMTAKVSRFNLADVRDEANHMLRQALEQSNALKAQAAEILQQAQAQAVEIKQNAQKQGFEEGYTLGMEEGKKQGFEKAHAESFAQSQKEFANQTQQVQTALTNVLAKFEAERDQMITSAQQELLALALSVAIKITHKQFEVDPSVAIENVKSSIGLVASRSSVVIRMNPTDMERFETFDAEKIQQLFNLQHVRMIKDDTVETGGCIVQTDNGKIDSQLSTQIENIVKHLAPAMVGTIHQWSAPAQKESEPQA